MNESTGFRPVRTVAGDDDTVRLVKPTEPAAAAPPVAPPVAKSSGGTPLWAGLGVAIGVAIGGAGLYFWPTKPPPAPVPPVAVVQPPPAPVPRIPIVDADANTVLTRAVTSMTIYRLTENPSILVFDFPTLLQQGRMLDRIAAYVEKADTPRERLLDDVELEHSVRTIGETPQGYYYGHDYGADSLAHFFRLVDRDKVFLNEDERLLRQVLMQEGWFTPGLKGGLISLPVVGADRNITSAARSAILKHELAHGEYFANPDFAQHVHSFWTTLLTQAERDGIRKFLISQGYDGANAELMENEAQAYLIFTNDPQFFSPQIVGMSADRRAEIQHNFHSGMKPGWLKDFLTPQLPPRRSADRR